MKNTTTRTINTRSHFVDEGEEKKDEPLSPDSTKPNEDSTKPNEDSPATSANDPLQSEKAVTPPLFVISDKKASRPFDCFGFGVHLLLFFLALACAASFCLSEIHKNYFVPVVERARRTDDDLMDEYTYYDRQCSLQDVTATPEQAREQLWIKENQPTSSKEVDGVEQMMTHGAVMIPELLSPQSVEELRAFVVQKNRAVKGTPAEFPVSQGFARISYGIEATEDPSVIRALKEIHGSEPLGKLLEGLVGKNPALTEITAITSGYGAPHQVWHSDVKSDGNGIKFGRTYSHSYSLFLALQNTTGAMGATDLCPGTHYCTNRISSVCESRKIGLHQLRPENIWRAGDAALLSQQVWHRGTKHTDPNAQERIIFIVSFIGRPADPRQLARGTYFHMKWNMWGHTWQDLKDSALSISWPFNVLRCLHIWKPKNREWGYDLITSAALRIGNNQLGCEPGDLEQFLDHLERMGFPEFLDGTIDFDSDEAWQVYIRETITNIFTFFLKVNGAALALYFGVTTLMALCMGSVGFAHFHRSVTRVIRAYSLVLGLMLYILYSVNSSSWAVDISSGKTLMRPFPPVESFWLEDPAVSKGPTQLPHSRDVLIGTRLNARTIGAYSSWMDFHPGNRDFLDYVSQYGGQLYRSYKQGLPSAFHQFLITNAIEEIRKKQGNFLQQDYRTGEWRGMTSSEIEDYVTLQLLLGRESLLAALKQEIDYLLDDCRFGFLFRTTTMSMSRVSQTHLQHLEKQFFGMPTSTSVYSKLPSQSFLTPKTFLPGMSTRKEDNRRVRAVFFPEEEPPAFFPNELVSLQSRDEDLIRATVVGLSKDDKYDIAFLGDFADYSAGKRRLPRSILSKTLPVMEGAPVHANYMQRGEWFRGRILRVGPSGHIDILFDDGDFEETVSSDFYSTATEWYKFE